MSERLIDQHFSVKAPAHEYSFSVKRGYLRLNRRENTRGQDWWSGEFLDPRGTVTIYRQSDYTRLDFIVDGTAHCRCWQKFWGDRTICRLARAFITDLTEVSND